MFGRTTMSLDSNMACIILLYVLCFSPAIAEVIFAVWRGVRKVWQGVRP